MSVERRLSQEEKRREVKISKESPVTPVEVNVFPGETPSPVQEKPLAPIYAAFQEDETKMGYIKAGEELQRSIWELPRAERVEKMEEFLSTGEKGMKEFLESPLKQFDNKTPLQATQELIIKEHEAELRQRQMERSQASEKNRREKRRERKRHA
jgi:hypothetical protein